MKSIKPGRGPSAMGAVVGVFVVIFGIFWTVMVSSQTRDSPFPGVGVIFSLFGVVFVIMAIVGVIYNARNATSRNRFSSFDITSSEEEPDPLNERFGSQQAADSGSQETSSETISARLSKIESLKEKGLISDEEYLEQRERILSEI
ncbi:MAG: SHOCT domain-containing protein [Verrucomicrobiota bacterium]